MIVCTILKKFLSAQSVTKHYDPPTPGTVLGMGNIVVIQKGKMFLSHQTYGQKRRQTLKESGTK